MFAHNSQNTHICSQQYKHTFRTVYFYLNSAHRKPTTKKSNACSSNVQENFSPLLVRLE